MHNFHKWPIIWYVTNRHWRSLNPSHECILYYIRKYKTNLQFFLILPLLDTRVKSLFLKHKERWRLRFLSLKLCTDIIFYPSSRNFYGCVLIGIILIVYPRQKRAFKSNIQSGFRRFSFSVCNLKKKPWGRWHVRAGKCRMRELRKPTSC